MAKQKKSCCLPLHLLCVNMCLILCCVPRPLVEHTARDIYIMKELEDIDTMERQTVSFLCEVNQEDLEGRWYRDDCRVRPGDNIKIKHQGGY